MEGKMYCKCSAVLSGYKTDIDASHKKDQRSLLSGSAGFAEA